MKKLVNLSNLTLLVALSLSTVAAYYSIIGLTAIFAGAVIPIIIMGSMLEIGKITATVWLRKYWHKASLALKFYLVPAVVLLALLTSMGIFGFLSRAHSDTGLVSGESQAKLAIFDEKIKTQRENIEIARKALQQMDAQVDARLTRGDSEQSAERAVQIRRQQAPERTKLQKDIADAQKEIAKLNEERAPIAAENRKIEAEVGPIKYIAALIYGDNPDANLLEAAVRWVIILLVIVFDPLAIALVLAANASKQWDKEEKEKVVQVPITPADEKPTVIDDKPYEEFKSEEEVEKFTEAAAEEIIAEVAKAEPDPYDFSKHAYLYRPWIDKVPGVDRVGPMVYKPEQTPKEIEFPTINEEKVEEKIAEPIEEVSQGPVEIKNESTPEVTITDEELSSTVESSTTPASKLKEVDGGYMVYEGKMIAINALKEMKPELFRAAPDSGNQVSTNFGTHFPKFAKKGDTFVRVDILPNKIFKFDGSRWFEVSRDTTQSYLENEEYIRFLISKIESGEYDLETLSDSEKESIELYLKSSK